MRLNLYVCLVFLFSLFHALHIHGNNNVFIVLNMLECNNCYNAISNLKKLDKNLPLRFIMKEEYAKDSADVIEILALDRFNFEFIWSDSMYQEYLIDNMFSSVILMNEHSNDIIKLNLKEEFNLEVVNYFNKLNKEIDTFNFEERVITIGAWPILNKKHNVYIFDQLKNTLSCHSMINGKKAFEIKMTDFLSKSAFQKKYGNDEAWKENEKLLESLEVLKSKDFSSFFVDENLHVFILANYKVFYISPAHGDTTLANFST